MLKVPHSNLSPKTSYCSPAAGFAHILEANSSTVSQIELRLRHFMCFHFTIAYCAVIQHNVIFTENIVKFTVNK